MTEIIEVKPTIDVSLFEKVFADSMKEARGKPFKPTCPLCGDPLSVEQGEGVEELFCESCWFAGGETA
jgi:hypothetical protein